ncbi:MAG: ankyrin repeat domain-containing protein [Myxococcales bacterium]|nr:ankyrin repeat domain-containing protein [Myxococcales bacterium]
MTDLFELLKDGKIKPFQEALNAKPKPKLTALNDDGESLLHLVAKMKTGKNLEFAEALVAAGLPIDLENEAGDSALHTVIGAASSTGLSKQQVATATWLIEHGADVNHPGEIKASTLHTAIIKGAQMPFVEQLIAAGADGGRKDHTEQAAFFLSMGTSNAPKLWSLLLEKWGGLNDRNEYGETPLHEAVSRHNASAVKFLLSKGADASVKTKKGETAFDQANRYAKKLVPLLS